jgi:UDP-glucose 4-epimerase
LTTPVGEFAAAVNALRGPGDLLVRDSSLVRDFVSRSRVATTLVMLSRVEQPPRVVNVCSGKGVSFAELIRAMAEIRGLAVRIVDTSPGGLARVVGDPTLLESLVGRREPEAPHQLARAALTSAS